MTIISKAALAAELGVTPGRVSQYLTAGLPERPDGKLNREECLDWLSRNARSGADTRKGPARAQKLRPQPPQPARSLGDAESARRGAVAVASEVAYFVAASAADLDLPMRVAFALTINVQQGILDVLRDFVRTRCIGVQSPGWSPSMPPAGIDWQSMADVADEPVDFEAWEAWRVEMFEKAGS